jgi:hypothetical protein
MRFQTQGTGYTLPIASASVLGGIKVGANLTINATTGVLDASGGTPPHGTYPGIVENDITLTTNYTIATGRNGMSAGPVTIDNGITITVPNGSVWSIV